MIFHVMNDIYPEQNRTKKLESSELHKERSLNGEDCNLKK